MNKLYGLTAIAETVAESIGVSDEKKSLIHRQLKHLLATKAILPTDRIGGRGDTVFDEREASKARIQLAVMDAGLDAKTLTGIEKVWDRGIEFGLEGLPLSINETFPPRALDAVLYDARREDAPEWFLVIVVRRNVETGERLIVGVFRRADQNAFADDDPASGKGPFADNVEVSEGHVASNGEVTWESRGRHLTIAEFRFPVTKLIKPLLMD
ncbi:MAG: hypothetical protein EOS85_01455 [Mesorhizobium sp.]|nr:MAG: hypothetical protein EOS85_01455 [Mesorhizobium sp.]